MVITELTRNFLKSWLFAPLKKPINTGFSPVRKLNILLFFPSVLSKNFWKKCGIIYTESCPSGRRCSTRNFLKSWPFAPLKKPINTGFSPVRKLNILLFFPSVLSKSFWKKCGITYTESCPSGRRCSTRNAVFPKGT